MSWVTTLSTTFVHLVARAIGDQESFIERETSYVLTLVMGVLSDLQSQHLHDVRATYSDPGQTTDEWSWGEDGDTNQLTLVIESRARMGPGVCSKRVTMASISPLEHMLDDATEDLVLLPGVRQQIKDRVRPLVWHKLNNPAYLLMR